MSIMSSSWSHNVTGTCSYETTRGNILMEIMEIGGRKMSKRRIEVNSGVKNRRNLSINEGKINLHHRCLSIPISKTLIRKKKNQSCRVDWHFSIESRRTLSRCWGLFDTVSPITPVNETVDRLIVPAALKKNVIRKRSCMLQGSYIEAKTVMQSIVDDYWCPE